MQYFIIIYRVIVNNQQTYSGKVGRATKNEDTLLQNTKTAIEENYRQLFPETGSINVIILKKREITMQEYLAFVKIAQSQN